MKKYLTIKKFFLFCSSLTASFLLLPMGIFAAEENTRSSGATLFGYILLAIACLILLAIMARGLRGHTLKELIRSDKKTEKESTDDLISMSEYYKQHPEFNAAQFKEMLGSLYVKTQNAWTRKDMQAWRNYFSAPYFKQIEEQVGIMQKLKRTNYITDIEVLDVNLEGVKLTRKSETIIATIRTKIIDYVCEDTTGAVISGDKRKEKVMVYTWRLQPITDHEKPEDFDWEICDIQSVSKTYIL